MRKLALVIAIAFFACNKKEQAKEPPKPDPKSAVPEAKPVEKPTAAAPPLPELTGLFNCHAADPNGKNGPAAKSTNPYALPFSLGGCPQVPPVYGAAQFGMPLDQAARAAKAKISGDLALLYLGKHPTKYQFALHTDFGKVTTFAFTADEEGFAAMKAAWGEPITYKALVTDEMAWFNPAAKIKVIAEPDKWNRTDPKTKQDVDVPGYHIRFRQYTPLAEVLGPEGIVQKPLLGAGPEELNKRFPGALEIKSEAEKKADMDKLGLDEKTKAQIAALGADKASADLKLLEVEVDDYHLLVQPDWKDSKIVRYSFILPFGKGKDNLKNELLAQVVQSLGKPTNVKQDEINKDRWVYTFKGGPGTKVELRSDILGEGWQLEVAPEK
jgi:hypothetical protein